MFRRHGRGDVISSKNLIDPVAFLLCVWVANNSSRAAEPLKLPLPEMTISRTLVPPTIDGRLDPGEWDHAPACTAWVEAFHGNLGLVQSTAWITYDDHYIYVAIKNNRGPKGAFLQKKARKSDDANIVFDPSNEIWLTPPVTPATTYQTLFNPYPAVLDAKMLPSLGYTSTSWQGHWKIAASESRDNWIVEARAEIKSFGQEAIKDGSTWRGLFCADLGDGYGFRAWAPGGAFADIPRHGLLHFRENTPVFQFLTAESIFTGKFQFDMAVTGPRTGKEEVAVDLRFGANATLSADDLTMQKNIAVAAGERRTFSMVGDLRSLRLPKRKLGGDSPQQDWPSGYCEVTAKTADGGVLYHQVFPFVINGWVRTPPAELQTTPYQTPFGLSAFYAPLNKQLVVKADRLYMPRRAEVVGGTARLKDLGGRVVAERKIAPFYFDYSEFPIDLRDLPVPVETEAAWSAAHKVKSQGNRPAVAPAEYDLEVALLDKAERPIATTTSKVKLLGYQFPWLPNDLGISDKVIPPWTPMEWKEGEISLWNKTYEVNGLGLADRILNGGRPQLTNMRLLATVNGHVIEIPHAKPVLKRKTDAGLDLAGEGAAGGIRFDVATRVEFDGCVQNTMRLSGTGNDILERLSLEMAMPADEAPCFVTTSGGWNAYHGWTPAKWDSRETSLGSMIGNFVPYVLLTDSDRGFCWFADSTKGWLLDPAQATQEVERKGEEIIFRVNFVTQPAKLRQPTTIKYGWTVTPQKPQPKGWRNWSIGPAANRKGLGVFWQDADRDTLWAYYSSPFPHNYEKSKQLLADADGRRGMVGCVGNIAHAIARYQDAEGRKFDALAADWGAVPGDTTNGNVCRIPHGSNDFQLWHWDQWIKKSGLSGLYFDETYLSEEWNYLGGNAYLTPDERVQPGYSYVGLRDLFKRLRYVFATRGKTPPNLWLHTTGGQAVYAWMPDVSMEGENVEPAGLDNDYLDCLPASRIRSIGMGRNLGSAPFIMCQTQRHYDPAFSDRLINQFVGWVLLHDALPEQVEFWHVLAGEMQMWDEEIRFLPYWKVGLGIASRTAGVLASAHVRRGAAAIWIMNTAKSDQQAELAIDLQQLGFDPEGPLRVFDAETGERYAIEAGVLKLTIPGRMWRCVRLVQDRLLAERVTFAARFDKDAVADAALGNPLPGGPFDSPLPRATGQDQTGRGVALDAAVSYKSRHNIPAGASEVALELRCDPHSRGTILKVPGLTVSLSAGQLLIQQGREKPMTAALRIQSGMAWHKLKIAWKDLDVAASCDGERVLRDRLASPVSHPMPRGIKIRFSQRDNDSAFTIGPVPGALVRKLAIWEL